MLSLSESTRQKIPKWKFKKCISSIIGLHILFVAHNLSITLSTSYLKSSTYTIRFANHFQKQNTTVRCCSSKLRLTSILDNFCIPLFTDQISVVGGYYREELNFSDIVSSKNFLDTLKLENILDTLKTNYLLGTS